MKSYEFRCYDHDDNTSTMIEFKTDNDCWTGYDGPMWKFFDFLKGCGFVFDKDAEIGVVDRSNHFESSVPDF